MLETHTMTAGVLTATFRPRHGMLGISLTHRGAEILRLLDDLDEAAATGRSVGVPLLHPWANRLSTSTYHAAGRTVSLDPASPWLMRDWNGVIVHGVPWSKLAWDVLAAEPTRLVSRLQWNRPELLAVFPFVHELQIHASLAPRGLEILTRLVAGPDGPVPASFGYHPQIGLPGVPRAQWRLSLPAMQRVILDERLLPTGAREPFPAIDAALGTTTFDDGFDLLAPGATMAISGGGRRVAVEFGAGYDHAQIYAPLDPEYISFEPMVAPTNALVSGEQLPLVSPGASFDATFQIRVQDLDAA